MSLTQRILFVAVVACWHASETTSLLAQLPSPYFYDDFEDGNASDSKPISWTTVSWAKGSASIENGNLILHPDNISPDVPGYDPSLTEIDLRADGVSVAEGSLRTRFRALDSGYTAIGVSVRDTLDDGDDGSNGVFGTNVWFGIDTTGFAAIGTLVNDGAIQPDDLRVLRSRQNGPDVNANWINLQVDMFGDHVSSTLWREGDVRPSKPQWTAQLSDQYNGKGAIVIWNQVHTDEPEQRAAFDFIALLPTASSPTLPGDFDDDFILTTMDVDLLAMTLRTGSSELTFDTNYDGRLDYADHRAWVNSLKHTWYGDANLDGAFDSADLVQVFVAGQFEDALADNSTWATGDANGDGEFDSGDLVMAFQDSGFERGPRIAVPVPEPTALAMCVCVVLAWNPIRRVLTNQRGQ